MAEGQLRAARLTAAARGADGTGRQRPVPPLSGSWRSRPRSLGAPRHPGRVSRRQVLSLDWHPDGNRVATGATDGLARVFEITSWSAEQRLAVATGGDTVTDVAFSPDGSRLLTGDAAETTAAVWDVGLAGGAEVANLPTARDRQTSAAFTVDGQSVVVSGEIPRAVVWDLTTRTAQAELGKGLFGGARDIQVDPHGALVVTVHGDNKPREVEVWEIGTGELRFGVPVTDVQAWAATCSPSGDLLAVSGLDDDENGTIGIFDRSGEPVTALAGDPLLAVLDVAFSPGGQQLVTVVGHPGGETGRVLLRDMASREVTDELPVTVWLWAQ